MRRARDRGRDRDGSDMDRGSNRDRNRMHNEDRSRRGARRHRESGRNTYRTRDGGDSRRPKRHMPNHREGRATGVASGFHIPPLRQSREIYRRNLPTPRGHDHASARSNTRARQPEQRTESTERSESYDSFKVEFGAAAGTLEQYTKLMGHMRRSHNHTAEYIGEFCCEVGKF